MYNPNDPFEYIFDKIGSSRPLQRLIAAFVWFILALILCSLFGCRSTQIIEKENIVTEDSVAERHTEAHDSVVSIDSTKQIEENEVTVITVNQVVEEFDTIGNLLRRTTTSTVTDKRKDRNEVSRDKVDATVSDVRYDDSTRVSATHLESEKSSVKEPVKVSWWQRWKWYLRIAAISAAIAVIAYKRNWIKLIIDWIFRLF